MKQKISIWDRFNNPAGAFDALAYIITALCAAGAILSLAIGLTDKEADFSIAIGLGFIVAGLILPQFFFALAKIVRAAEKYLGER